MNQYTQSTKVWRESLIIVISWLMASTAVFATDSQLKVPDLLNAPSIKNIRALGSLQLAVDRAGKRLVSVGERGIVLLSDDHGVKWRQATLVPVSVALTDVSFVSEKLGWASGHSGVVLKTSDGGETWVKKIDGKEVAKVIYDEAVARLDAGEKQAKSEVRNAEYLLKEGADKPFLNINFIDQNIGWVIGAYGIAITTEDGGESWKSLTGRIPNPGGKHLYQLSKNKKSLVIAGEQGTLFASYDDGLSFNKIQMPYSGTFFGSVGLDDGEILAYGLRGNLWRSYDHSKRWQKIELGHSVTITSANRKSDGTILLTDESGRVYRGDSNGETFSELNIPPVAGLTDIIEAIDGSVILTSTRGSKRMTEVNSKEVLKK